ncbi:MAG: hypothetical protein RIS47_829 [Bacteroidota bacterium]|jgi:sulfite exporter TauE/SafE
MIWTAFMMGLIGNFHCAGMCGPLAIAVPLDRSSWLKRLAGSLTYNLGRTLTYAIMGAIFGLLGQGFAMAGFQRWLSILMGVLMIAIVIFPSLFKNPFDSDRGLFRLVGGVKAKLRKLFSIRSYKSLFSIGLLNGLLPCGLVYFAIVGAIATGSVTNGMMYMAAFGLGTLPIMLAIPILGTMISAKLRTIFTKSIPIVMIFIGGLFILRGLDLGIPFVSPPDKVLHVETAKKYMEEKKMGMHPSTEKKDCCHKAID